jgi:hypothetical protein
MFEVGSPLFVGVMTGVVSELILLMGEYSAQTIQLSERPLKKPYRPMPPDVPFSYAFVLTTALISGAIGCPLFAVGYGLVHCTVSLFRVAFCA